MININYTAIIQKQRLRIIELERELIDTYEPPFNLPKTELIILQTLLKRNAVSKEGLYAIIYTGLRESQPAITVIESHISKLRTKLQAYGVNIKNNRQVGYAISNEHKAILRKLSHEQTLCDGEGI